MPGTEWLPPILVAAGVASIGWMLRYILTSITDKLDDLEATFTGVTAELARELAMISQKLTDVDRRVIRLESWKDLLEFTSPRRGSGE